MPSSGAEFDLKTGEAVTLPATKSVNTYKTEIIDGYIYVEMVTNAQD